ncbi:MAG: amino acid ABC transporter substrate-binding protein [Anaerolineales bacterium]|nr:amino acid ABC transporter substrate-binding protein [Anaerolineales bacterium]
MNERYLNWAVRVIGLVILLAIIVACAPAPTPVPPTKAVAAPTTAAPTMAPAATKPPEPTKAAAPPAPAYIDIGASIPLTGKFGSLGQQVRPGYAYAVKDINDAGGIYVKEYDKKIPLRLTVYDDESDPTKAVSKMETLFADNKVVAYLGGAASDMHVATTAIAEKNKVPYLGIAFALNAIHQKGYKYLFSPFPKSVQQGPDTFLILNALIPEGQRPLKVAIFQEKSDWGAEQGALWKENAVKNGYTVVVAEEYAVGTTNFVDLINKAKAAGAETLLALPNQPSGEALVKQMVELGWTPKFSLIIRAPENVTWSTNLGKNGDYVTIFPGWHNAMKFPGVDKLNAAYQAEFKRPADLLTGPSYACVQILAAAIEKAGTLNRDKIRDAIAATNMTTVIGPVTFNADGTAKVLDPLIQWQSGKLEMVWPKDQATKPLLYPAPPFDKR